MKRLALLLLLSSLAYGQAAMNGKPDCVIGFSLTGTGRVPAAQTFGGQVGFDNRTQGCTIWHLTYYSTGFSALSIEVDFATDSGGLAGSWTIWPAASIATGSLPLTTTTENQISVGGFHPWVSVNLSSVTGTGTVGGVLYGWRSLANDDASTFESSSQDPCGNPNIAKSFVAVNISSATTTQLVGLAANQKVYVCQFSFTAAGTAPTILFVRGTGASCGTGTTSLTGTFAPTAGTYMASPGGPGTAFSTNFGTALCITSGGTPSIQGYVSFIQQ